MGYVLFVHQTCPCLFLVKDRSSLVGVIKYEKVVRECTGLLFVVVIL